MNSLYNVGERVDIARPPADSFLVFDSADRSSSTSATNAGFIPQTQPFNNFRLQKPENLVQGGFTRLQLTEINFPYAIPNVNARNNSFWVVLRRVLGDVKAQISLPIQPASYTGSEIASALTAILNASAVGGGLATWSVIYYPDNAISGFIPSGFSISTIANVNNLDFALYPVEPILNYPLKPTLSADPTMFKSLLDVMGYSAQSNWEYLTGLNNTIPNLLLSKSSTYAPLTYTKYIDIISNKLTYYANVKDGSTRNNSGSSIICRLYISDEVSNTQVINRVFNGVSVDSYLATPPAGSVPFVIHRQFQSPKQFKWEPDTAVDWIDIQLLDDMGQLLYVPEEGLPDFQITFKATEN